MQGLEHPWGIKFAGIGGHPDGVLLGIPWQFEAEERSSAAGAHRERGAAQERTVLLSLK